MPIQPNYPGVYVQEIPSGVRTITGVSTSVTAFLGVAKRGPINKAVHVLSLSDYERSFGGLSADSPMSYAVSQFFLNGGTEAWVVRLAKNAQYASLPVNDASGQVVFTVQALDEGKEGNQIQIQIAPNQLNQDNFDITFAYTAEDNPSDSTVETFTNVSLDPTSPRFIEDVINDVSQLVTVAKASSGSTAKIPAVLKATAGTLTSGAFASTDLDALPAATQNSFCISIDGDQPSVVKIDGSIAQGASLAPKLQDIAARIKLAIRRLKPALPAYRNFDCSVSGDNLHLVLTSGTIDSTSAVAVSAAPTNDIAQGLHLLSEAHSQVGTSPALSGGAGDTFSADEAFDVFIGDPLLSRPNREGIYALEEVDLFNLMCLPGITDANILADAITYCKERRAFLIIDAPLSGAASTPTNQSPDDMVNYINGANLPKGDFGTYAALYYPWPKVADPLNNGKLRLFPPSGMIAGLYARTDSTRGVWKAPAGTDAVLVGVRGLERQLTDADNGTLNPHGVNCLRVFPVYGPVCWGARTVSGDDQLASEYKYVPIRRLALYLEESLFRGLKWVVFEPNDEPLWAQIRLNVGAFMHNLFRQGAFQGQTPKDAYFVLCDKDTTTQNDRDLGIVNVVVGFAPLKPAEFVILSLQQIAGQIDV